MTTLTSAAGLSVIVSGILFAWGPISLVVKRAIKGTRTHDTVLEISDTVSAIMDGTAVSIADSFAPQPYLPPSYNNRGKLVNEFNYHRIVTE